MAKTQPEPGPYNVILISFDTMRRDVLHCYGCRKRTSPNLDRLAAEGVLFTDAIVNCGWTLPQHITMLTGLHPLRHKVYYVVRKCRLAARFRTLAEIFREHGYLTFGFANTNRYGGGWEYGFWRGMRHYTTVFPGNNMMEQVVEPVTWAMRMAGVSPFFIYIHAHSSSTSTPTTRTNRSRLRSRSARSGAAATGTATRARSPTWTTTSVRS
ncbi:MAG: hypothetical protein AMK75_07920 [Planctomycetes bacterium SM23_65]|nr:MAG: hypothetical protein AMK75_07920 [Planctomycetes bacterium SM23_65]